MRWIQTIPKAFKLPAAEIQLWCLRQSLFNSLAQGSYTYLSAPERRKAARFYFTKDRNRFILGRALLRCFLASYTRQRPEAVKIAYRRYGKPYLVLSKQRLQFNLSHSGDLLLFAFSRAGELGIDVEWVDPARDLSRLAKRFFSPREWADLAQYQGKSLQDKISEQWCQKEALLKARGVGLKFPLAELKQASAYQVKSINLPLPSYCGAVAWKAKQRITLRGFSFLATSPGFDSGPRFLADLLRS